MSAVGGWDLLALIREAAERGQTLSPALVAHIGIEACHGLVRLHRRGQVHRAVTPAAFVLSYGGDVKLVRQDWAPSSWYMAPEQAREEPVDLRADVYALGVVLLEAYRGRRVREEDLGRAFRQAYRGERLAVEGPLAATLRRATEPAREARFRDADEMRQALEIDLVLLPREGGDLATELSALLRTWGVLRSHEQLPGVSHEATTFTRLGDHTPRRFGGTLVAAVLGSVAGLGAMIAVLALGMPAKIRAAPQPALVRCKVHGVQPRCDGCPGGDGVYSGRTLNATIVGVTLQDDGTFRCAGGVITPQ